MLQECPTKLKRFELFRLHVSRVILLVLPTLRSLACVRGWYVSSNKIVHQRHASIGRMRRALRLEISAAVSGQLSRPSPTREVYTCEN